MDEKEIHLRDYLRLIAKRKSTVCTFFVITLVVVIIGTFTATPIFKSSAKVMVERNASSSLTSYSNYIRYDPEFLETQNEIIKSSSVAKKVVRDLDVEKIYGIFFPEDQEKSSFFTPVISTIKDYYVIFKKMIGIDKIRIEENDASTVLEAAPQPLTKSEQLEKIIQNGIQVEPIPESRVFRIGFMSPNPALAMKIANSIAQAYIDELMDMRMEVSGYSIKWMTKKAEAQRIKLEESEKALHQYQLRQNIVTVEDRITVIPERLSELSKRLTKAETEKKELDSVYTQIRNTKKRELETIPAIAEDSAIASINQQIITAEQKISELSKKYGSKHPIMITAVGELKSLQRKKTKKIQNAVQTIRNRYELAGANVQNLTKLLTETKREATNLNEKNIQLKILKREVETNRYLYDALIKKLKEKGITEETQLVNVWVIEEAVFPLKPAKPNKKRNILLGVVLGLFGGIGLAFFLEYLDNTVKTPEDIEDRFNVPVLGTVGLSKDKNQTLLDIVTESDNSPLSECFKSLRTSIFLSSADHPPKAILVTSMSPQEGKSSISSSLAVTIAKTGKSTILIDADMRRPKQHKLFNIENITGLSSFLAGLSHKDLIQSNVRTSLDVMTAGPIPPNPSELLSSERFGKMIHKLNASYDMIIVDTPPVISVSDALIIAKHCQGAIVITVAGSTTYELVNKGIKLFKDVSAPLTGMVINKFDARKSGYYYGYGDYYYSSSSESS